MPNRCGTRRCSCTVAAEPGVTVAGNGSPTDPYIVGSDVVVNPSPPDGGTELLHPGPDGCTLSALRALQTGNTPPRHAVRWQ